MCHPPSAFTLVISVDMPRSWTKIGKLLPGRSENAVKNRWNSAARKKGIRNQQRNMAGLATVSPILPTLCDAWC